MNRPAPEQTAALSARTLGASRVEVKEWSLEVLAGPDKGRSASTLGSLLRVGSDPGGDLVLRDTTVSRRHLEVERAAQGFLLRDLGSRNGTRVDGRQVVCCHLEPGDKVALGKTRLQLRQVRRGTSVELLREEIFGTLVGRSEPMRSVFAALRAAARTDASLLIEGETGTGKEQAARAVHAHSDRARGPFRVVDGALLSAEALERELLGGPAGPGLFEQAAGGTLFFDELGELSPAAQQRLARLLDQVGTETGAPYDCRLVASTQHNLDEDVRQGRFAAELLLRIAVGRVRLPPLRTRRADLPLLAEALLAALGMRFELSEQTLALFEGYSWPGNVRELRNVLERGALLQQTGETTWLDFLPEPPQKGSRTQSAIALSANLPYHEAKDRVLADFERYYFAEVMKQSGFDLAVAEQKTGLSMQSLYRLLKKSGLRLKDLKQADGA